MLGVTFFGLFLTPVFYVLLRTLARKMRKRAADSVVPAPVHAAELEGAMK
jgi:multidrug efflux pump